MQFKNNKSFLTMMAKIKTPVYPEAVFRNRYIFLGIHWPLAYRWDCFLRRSGGSHGEDWLGE